MISKVKNIKFILALATIIVVISYISSQFIIIRNNSLLETTIGIIDGSISVNYDKITYNSKSTRDYYTGTHGDEITKFANEYCPGVKIYYYDATNTDGKIDTEGIISGLKWMKENGVKQVNISMSSNTYSDELTSYINDNKDEFQLFASYHNLEQSLDYPAMYDNVIGSSKRSKVIFKDIDVQYKSNNIILVSDGFKIYRGNSYLSLLTMLNSI